MTLSNEQHNTNILAKYISEPYEATIAQIDELHASRVPTKRSNFILDWILEPACLGALFLSLITPGLKLPEISKVIIFGGAASLFAVRSWKYGDVTTLLEEKMNRAIELLHEEQEMRGEELLKIASAKSVLKEQVSEEIARAARDKELELKQWELSLVDAENKFHLELQEKSQQFEQIKKQLQEKVDSKVDEANTLLLEKDEQIAYLQDMIQRLNAPVMPLERAGYHNIACMDVIRTLLMFDPKIVTDCYQRQPIDNGLSHTFWLTLRDSLQVKYFIGDESFREWVAFKAQLPKLPFFTVNSREGTVQVDIPINDRYTPPKHYQIIQTISEVKAMLKPAESLLELVKNENHVLVWGASGDGKTTFMGNLIGATKEQMGVSTKVISIVPKIDSDTQKVFGNEINYVGFEQAIMGLLEAVTETHYRNEINTGAYQAQKPIEDWQPIIYCFDEYSEIATAWNRVDKQVMVNVLERFKATLDTDRLEVFSENIEPFLSHNNFANQCLKFLWRFGRSLKIKSLVFGQNMMPSVLNVNIPDFDNVAFICLASSTQQGIKYKVAEFEKAALESERGKVLEIMENNPEFKYHALAVPHTGKGYFMFLPQPGAYQASDQKSQKSQIESDSVTESVSDDFKGWSDRNLKSQIMGQNSEMAVWKEAPRKLDGKIAKEKFYLKYGVKKSTQRKIVSQFVDYLEKKFC